MSFGTYPFVCGAGLGPDGGQAPPLDPNKLRYSVVPGNNSRLIKIAMARRKDFWLETTSTDPHFHFKWQSWSGGMKFLTKQRCY